MIIGPDIPIATRNMQTDQAIISGQHTYLLKHLKNCEIMGN
jgi:hypothetical protein